MFHTMKTNIFVHICLSFLEIVLILRICLIFTWKLFKSMICIIWMSFKSIS